MQTVTIKGKIYNVEETGWHVAPYNLTLKNQKFTGISVKNDTNIIEVWSRNFKIIGLFDRRTFKEITIK